MPKGLDTYLRNEFRVNAVRAHRQNREEAAHLAALWAAVGDKPTVRQRLRRRKRQLAPLARAKRVFVPAQRAEQKQDATTRR